MTDAAIWLRLEDIRLWLQKQADECRQSAEQIEGRVRAGRPFNGDENVAAHNRKNQAFFQKKADTISEAQDTALRADALAPSPDTGQEPTSAEATFVHMVRRDALQRFGHEGQARVLAALCATP